MKRLIFVLAISLSGFSGSSSAASCHNEYNGMVSAGNALASMSRSDSGYSAAASASTHASIMWAQCMQAQVATIEG
ncbi:MAG: hypothetical protein HRT53_17560 [Colwellia sp.]|nr:hypothetical protein [Colwellia sp.]